MNPRLPSQRRLALACVGRAGPRTYPSAARWFVCGRLVMSSRGAPRVDFIIPKINAMTSGTPLKMFPVLTDYQERKAYPDVPRRVPWELVALHVQQILENHDGQTLERLAQRGGLSPIEIWAAANGINPFRSKNQSKLPTTQQAIVWLKNLIVTSENKT